MKLRQLNERGIDRFNQYRASFPEGVETSDLGNLLQDDACSHEIAVEVDVESRRFQTRFAVGEYLNELFDRTPVPGLDVDRGIWSWLSAFYFDQLCAPNRRLGAEARWVPAVGNFQRYYRHLLAGPYQIYRAHRDNPRRSLAILANPPHRPGDIAEQLASRQELVTNPSVMEVATSLYINLDTDSQKLNAAGKGPGSARRLADVLSQLDLTWDLYDLTSNQLLDLLPAEFDPFKP